MGKYAANTSVSSELSRLEKIETDGKAENKNG